MNFSDYAELEKRAEAHGIGDDPALAQLLHIIQFKEVVVRGHKRTMRDLADWEKTIVKSVEQRIEEAMVADGCDEIVVTAVAIPTLSAPKYRRLFSATKTQSATLMRRSKKSPT